MDIAIVAAVLVVVLLLAVIIARLFGARTGAKLPYIRQESVLTPAERSFLGVLKEATGDEFEILCKIRMADVLQVPPRTPERQAHMNRIISKHLDFVLCNPTSLAPVAAIELDDSSHRRGDRQTRDAFVDAAMAAAALPLIRIAAKRAYKKSDIATAIRDRLA
jgi:hypothetical protein